MLNIVLEFNSYDQVLLNTCLAETVLQASADVWQTGEQLGNVPAAEKNWSLWFDFGVSHD